MARPWISWTPACAAALLLVSACQMDNPAFDDNANSGETGTTKETTTGETASGETTAGSSTSEATTTGNEAPDPPPDMDEGLCMPDVHEGYFPRFGDNGDFAGGCLPDVYDYVRVHAQTDDGDWLATHCPEGCSACIEKEIVVSAQSLALADLIPPFDPNDNLPTQGCYFVEAHAFLGADSGECIYGTMSVFEVDEGLGALAFHVNRESWGLTEMAAGFLGGWEPSTVEQLGVDQCVCDDNLDIELECCPGELIVPKKFQLSDNTYVYPGQSEAILVGQIDSYLFFAGQAQAGMWCEPEDETSWALLAI